MTGRLGLAGVVGCALILALAHRSQLVDVAPFDATDEVQKSWCDRRIPARHVLGLIDRRLGILCQEGDGYHGLFVIDLKARAARLLYPSSRGMPMEIAPGPADSWLVARPSSGDGRSVDRIDPDGHGVANIAWITHFMKLPRWDGEHWTSADLFRVLTWNRDFMQRRRWRWDEVANDPPDGWNAEGWSLERRAVWWHENQWWLVIEQVTTKGKHIGPGLDPDHFRMVSSSGEWRHVPRGTLGWHLGWFSSPPRGTLLGNDGQDRNARYGVRWDQPGVVRAVSIDGHAFVLRKTPFGVHLLSDRGDSFLMRTKNRYELVIDERGEPLLVGIDRPRVLRFNGDLQLAADFLFTEPGAFDADHPVIVPGSLSGDGTRPSR